MEDYLSQTAERVELVDDPDQIRDALFFGDVSYVLRVPDGFSDLLAQDQDNAAAKIERQAAPDSTTSLYMDMLVNKYLNTVRLFKAGLPEASDEEIVGWFWKTLPSAHRGADSTENVPGIV